MYGQEVEKEMMARNQEQFGFRVIDVPRVPDRKSGPGRAKTAATAGLSSAFVLASYFIARDRRRKSKETEHEKLEELPQMEMTSGNNQGD